MKSIMTVSSKLRGQLKQKLFTSLILGAVLLICFLIQPVLLNKSYIAYCTDTTGHPDDYIRCFSSYWDFYYLFGIAAFTALLVVPGLIGFYFLVCRLWSRNRTILYIVLFALAMVLLFWAKFIGTETKIFIKGFLSHNPQ